MKSLFCRVCKNEASLEKLIAKDYFLGTKQPYEYYLCPKCGSLSLGTIPRNLADLYANYYSFFQPLETPFFKFFSYKYIINHNNFIANLFSYFLKNQEDLPIKSLQTLELSKENAILDVGCGSGSLLRLLHKMGFKNCTGIDPYLNSTIHYPEGLSIQKKEFSEISDKFDLVMFHHVFEHFPNPGETLIHLSKILTDGGTCIIRMPDIDSFSFLKYKENWFSIHAPFHIALPSRKGLDGMAKNAGLKVQKMVGEQLLSFFLLSKGHELGVSDYDDCGNRRHLESLGLKAIPPLHVKSEIKEAKERLKQVQKYNLCDWSTYYLKKEHP